MTDEPSAPLSADAQCDLIEHIRDQMGEVLDDLSGWDRSLWTQEARLKEAIDILTETLPQLDRLAAAVREGEAREGRLVELLENFAVEPDEVPNQDELGGCVHCGATDGTAYGYAAKYEHHLSDCPWKMAYDYLKAREALAAGSPEGAE